MFFDVIDRRYSKEGPNNMIFTSNKTPDKWGEFFGEDSSLLPDFDMVFWLIPFSFILLNGNNNLGPVSRWLNYHGCALWAKLGKMVMYIYLLHIQVIMISKHLIKIDHSIAGSLLVLAVALVFAAVVMTIWEMIRRRRSHYLMFP